MGNNASSTSQANSQHKSSHSAVGHETKQRTRDREATASRSRGTLPSQNTTTTSHNRHTVHQEYATTNASPSPSPVNPPTAQDLPSKPVPISIAASDSTPATRSHRSSLETSVADMSYHLTRPPRLPLPIEEEVHTPGSPIIPPLDAAGHPLEVDYLDAELTRKASQSSNTTVDEEDEDGELQLDKTRAVVPTLVEWISGNENSKVYVTGSIFSWNKKQRLHPDPNRPGVFIANVHVRPGTHHLNFLIDGVMTTSTHLPTTVDFNNHLVNYIEVSPDAILQPPLTPTSASKPAAAKPPPPTPKMKPTIPHSAYTKEIPGYLEDLDLPEDSDPYQRAAAAIEKLPAPPSLPGFLGKPILNAATPMKDDNSVLVFPNHTVLNHLATSSIKNGVLAVSATTRYKKKYVTTIMYKPT